MSSLEMVAKDVKDILSKTKFEALEHYILIDILNEHKGHDLWKELLSSIKKHFSIYYIMEKMTIAEKLIVANENELSRELLIPYLADGENLFITYMNSFESIENITYETRGAYKVVCELYDSGYRYKTLIKSKCSFEKQMDITRKLYKTLQVYKELFGVDEFYAIY